MVDKNYNVFDDLKALQKEYEKNNIYDGKFPISKELYNHLITKNESVFDRLKSIISLLKKFLTKSEYKKMEKRIDKLVNNCECGSSQVPAYWSEEKQEFVCKYCVGYPKDE